MAAAFGSLSVDDKLDRLYNALVLEIENNNKRHSELSNQLVQWKSEVESNVNGFKTELESVMHVVRDLKNHDQVVDKKIQSVERTLNDLEQKSLSCDILITGIDEVESNNTDLVSIVNNTLQLVKIDKPFTVISARRIGKAAQDRTKPRMICVQLNNCIVRNSILTAKRKRQITVNEIRFKNKPIGTSNDKVYFNENLTKLNSEIFYAARQLLKRKLINLLWIRNGSIFYKENKDSIAARFCDMDSVKLLVSKHNLNSTPVDDVFLNVVAMD